MEKTKVNCSNPLRKHWKNQLWQILGISKNYTKRFRSHLGKFEPLRGKPPILEKTETGEFLSKLDCLCFFSQDSVGDHMHIKS